MPRMKRRLGVIGTYKAEASAALEKYLRKECIQSATLHFPELNATYFFVHYTDPNFPLKFSGPGEYSFGDITGSAKDMVAAIAYAKEKVERAKNRIEGKKEEIAKEADKAIISGKPY